jgi:hypothetical protein
MARHSTSLSYFERLGNILRPYTSEACNPGRRYSAYFLDSGSCTQNQRPVVRMATETSLCLLTKDYLLPIQDRKLEASPRHLVRNVAIRILGSYCESPGIA